MRKRVRVRGGMGGTYGGVGDVEFVYLGGEGGCVGHFGGCLRGVWEGGVCALLCTVREGTCQGWSVNVWEGSTALPVWYGSATPRYDIHLPRRPRGADESIHLHYLHQRAFLVLCTCIHIPSWLRRDCDSSLQAPISNTSRRHDALRTATIIDSRDALNFLQRYADSGNSHTLTITALPPKTKKPSAENRALLLHDTCLLPPSLRLRLDELGRLRRSRHLLPRNPPRSGMAKGRTGHNLLRTAQYFIHPRRLHKSRLASGPQVRWRWKRRSQERRRLRGSAYL